MNLTPATAAESAVPEAAKEVVAADPTTEPSAHLVTDLVGGPEWMPAQIRAPMPSARRCAPVSQWRVVPVTVEGRFRSRLLVP